MKIGMISLFLLSSQVSSKASDEWVVVEDDDYYIVQRPGETLPPIEEKEEVKLEEIKTPEQCWALIPYHPPLFLKTNFFSFQWSPIRKIRRIGKIGV